MGSPGDEGLGGGDLGVLGVGRIVTKTVPKNTAGGYGGLGVGVWGMVGWGGVVPGAFR